MHYLQEHDGEFVDVPVRFDAVSMLVCGDNRAFLKHMQYVTASSMAA